jgi:hypothetical protein
MATTLTVIDGGASRPPRVRLAEILALRQLAVTVRRAADELPPGNATGRS